MARAAGGRGDTQRRQAGDALDHLESAQVGRDLGVARHADRVVFESRLNRRHLDPVPLCRELHADHAGAEALGAGFGEAGADPGGVRPAADETGKAPDDRVADLLLLLERHFRKLDHERDDAAHGPGDLHRADYGKVAVPADVEAEARLQGRIQRRAHDRLELGFDPALHLGLANVLRQHGEAVGEGEAQHGRIVHPRFDQRPGQPGAGALRRDAVELFVGGVAIVSDQLLAPVRFLLRRPFAVLVSIDQAHALEQAVAQRLVQVEADQAIADAAGADIGDGLVERVVCAVVGRDHQDLAAPHQEGHGRLQQLAEIVDEGGLVEDRKALAAAQRTRLGRERDDREARGEVDLEGLDPVIGAIVEQRLTDLAADMLEHARPVRGRVDELLRHVVRGAHVERVHAAVAARRGRTQHGVRRRPPGGAGAAGLLDEDDVVLLAGDRDGALVAEQRRGLAPVCRRGAPLFRPDGDPGVTARPGSDIGAGNAQRHGSADAGGNALADGLPSCCENGRVSHRAGRTAWP